MHSSKAAICAALMLILSSMLCFGQELSKDLASIRNDVIGLQEKILDIAVEYRATGYDQRFASGAFVHRSIRYNKAGDFYHLSAHGADSYDWGDDLYAQVSLGVEGRLFYGNILNRRFKTFLFDSNEQLPGSMPYEFFLQATGIWPSNRPRPIPDFTLLTIAKSEDYVQLGSACLAGIECLTLSNHGLESLYFDKNRPGVLVQREVFNEAGELIQRFLLEDFEDFGQGIWLPRIIKNYYNLGRALESNQRPTLVLIEKYSLNSNVRVKAYLPDFAPGSLIESDDGSSLTTSGFSNHLDSLVAWAKRQKRAN